MSHELYKRWRPRKISQVVGQNRAIASLRKMMDEGTVPHALLLSGPSGTGKTTLARILRRFLKCSATDYQEINTADFRGIDTIREMRKNCQLLPMGGETRVFLVDEAHKLTSDGQNAILKLLEDTADHVYFILATTDPNKLIATVLGRCTEVKLNPIAEKDMQELLQKVIKEEKLTIGEDILDEIIEAAEGSARKALVILEAVSKVEGDVAQKEALMHTTLDKDLAFELARMLLWPKGNSWTDIAALLRKLENYEAEGIKQMVLALARSSLIGAKTGGPPKNPGRGAMVIEIFNEMDFYSRHPGLALACYKVFCQK